MREYIPCPVCENPILISCQYGDTVDVYCEFCRTWGSVDTRMLEL